MPAVQTDVRFSLVLPEAIYNQYALFAQENALSNTEGEMVRRLTACVKMDSTNPLYLSDGDRNQLNQTLGRMVRTPAELLSILKQKHEIKVGSVKVPLDDQLITRLETRRFGLSLEELIRKQVVECLEQFVGIR